MIQLGRRAGIVAFFAMILVIDWVLYFRHAEHFFQGDTIFLIDHRAHSVGEYLNEFVALNPSGWYRPLANELVQSVVYAIAGLNPVPYRIPVYIVFIGITVGVYALSLRLTGRNLAAGIATFFFTVHTVNAYTTYDVGFMPELLMAFFYIAGTIAFFRYLDKNCRKAYWISVAFFVCCLLSKEAAVTMPATLVLLGLLFHPASRIRDRFVPTLRAVTPFVVVLLLYLAFAVGHLHVMSVSISSLVHPPNANPGDYVPVFGLPGILRNADLAASWVFNLPRLDWSRRHDLTPALMSYLKLFRVVVLALSVLILIRHRRSERAAVLFGIAWFWVTLAPALPLVTHFIPYYVFLPAVGVAFVVGVVLTWVHDLLRGIQPVMGAAAVVLVLGLLLAATNRTIKSNIRDNPLLGGSARRAQNTLADLKRFYPMLPPKATLYFEDGNESVAWEHDFGGLLKIAYARDDITPLYQSQNEFPPLDGRVLAFAVKDEHLIDETSTFHVMPAAVKTVSRPDLQLDLSASEVGIGDKYTLRIDSLSSVPVRILYTIDDGGVQSFAALLDSSGSASFEVSRHTSKGRYRFFAFRVSDGGDWIRADQTLVVR